MNVSLRLTGRQHTALERHLLPSDGCEAVALALCGRRAGDSRHVLTVYKVEAIPHEECSLRAPERVTWPTARMLPLLEEARRKRMALLKIHSHPGGLAAFSAWDDVADRELFASVHGQLDDDLPHASAVMLPGGRIFGRAHFADGSSSPLGSVAVAGEDLRFWHPRDHLAAVPDFAERHAQAFGGGTTSLLRRLSIAVVGCSGTGSPLVEMLARLGVGELVLVDPDHVERRNLNRILGATARDAERMAKKVDVLARTVAEMGLGTRVVALPADLFAAGVAGCVAQCDLVFGCMDGVDGRDLLNRLAAFYLLPYFDVGVRLDADGSGGIDQICGTVHYLQPDGSSLLSRGLYTPELLRAAGLKRTNPEMYRSLIAEKYIKGVQEDRPAVISVNVLYAALAVNELLARLHGYRDDGDAPFAQYGMSLTQARLIHVEDGEPCRVLARHAGRGDTEPLLNLPALSGPAAAA